MRSCIDSGIICGTTPAHEAGALGGDIAAIAARTGGRRLGAAAGHWAILATARAEGAKGLARTHGLDQLLEGTPQADRARTLH